MRTLAIIVGLVTGLALAEAGVRMLRLDRPVLQLALIGSTDATSAYDPRLGWTNLPDSRGSLHFRGADRELRLTTNHQGFRFPRDFTRQKTRPFRMALVGDSQVFGFGVADDKHLGAILDAGSEQVETYPFGVPGYGPTQEMLLLEETILDYHPDIVVAVLFLENDLKDQTEDIGYGLPKPFLHEIDGRWEVTNVPVPMLITTSLPAARTLLAPLKPLFDVSALYRLVFFRAAAAPALASTLARLGLGAIRSVAVTAGAVISPHAGDRADGVAPACNRASECPEQHRLDGLPATVAAYERMRRSCESRGIRFVALVSPAVFEVQTMQFPMSDAVRRALEERHIETISLAQPFARTPNPRRLIGFDLHWSAYGTRLVALILRERLRNLFDTAATTRP